jgi:hypothetical protein
MKAPDQVKPSAKATGASSSPSPSAAQKSN